MIAGSVQGPPTLGTGPPPGTGEPPRKAAGRPGGRFLQTAVPPPGARGPPRPGPADRAARRQSSPIRIRAFAIPVSAADRTLAASGGEPRSSDVERAGHAAAGPDPAARRRAARSRSPARSRTPRHTLDTLVLSWPLVSAGGIALAAALGPFVARTALAPAGEVSDAAEEVARTHDLTRRIEVRGDDELGRLAASFNEMMAALERSEAAQRRLVADASHELRTPLATLRTNIETLGRSEDLDPEERERLVADLTDELEEMTELVADVVELARAPGQDAIARRDVALDELARDAVERAERRARELSFEQHLQPSLVHADPQRLGRAISNLLDNAAKWSPPEGDHRGRGRRRAVTVRDHGPGFPPDDLDKVFDRFWRSDEARGKPGSGLGLAIVQRVADEHGGRASAANAEGGGAVVSLRLPEIQRNGSNGT